MTGRQIASQIVRFEAQTRERGQPKTSREPICVLRIGDRSLGHASGRADVRLNRDRNEVEMINVNGRMGPTNFTGNFSRN